MIVFGFLPQDFGRCQVPMQGNLSFYVCRLSGGELRGVTQTLPAVMKFV